MWPPWPRPRKHRASGEMGTHRHDLAARTLLRTCWPVPPHRTKLTHVAHTPSSEARAPSQWADQLAAQTDGLVRVWPTLVQPPRATSVIGSSGSEGWTRAHHLTSPVRHSALVLLTPRTFALCWLAGQVKSKCGPRAKLLQQQHQLSYTLRTGRTTPFSGYIDISNALYHGVVTHVV